MLHLPPGQGFSIYSLAAVLPLLAAKQRSLDPADWMSDRRRGGLPRPQLRHAHADHAARAPPLPPRGDDGGADAGGRRVRTDALGPGHPISRVVRGGWQLSEGHSARVEGAVEDLVAAAEAGITTFDCADIYTGVEERMGAMRREVARRHGEAALEPIRVHTKLVPDLDALAAIGRAEVRAAIDRSRERLGMERLDLVQFHWWDLGVERWREVAGWLAELREAGAIRTLGATNFDAAGLSAMLGDGVPLRAMQVQYSVLDDRPARALAEVARRGGVRLLCYGTVAGGFLSDRWLGRPEPEGMLENRSLVKYKLIVDDAGGWDALQAVLRALRRVADRHDVDAATVASAWTLAQPGVAAVIVGARDRAHLGANLAVDALRLGEDDLAEIEAARRTLRPLAGEVYALERDRTSPHGGHHALRPAGDRGVSLAALAEREVRARHGAFEAWLKGHGDLEETGAARDLGQRPGGAVVEHRILHLHGPQRHAVAQHRRALSPPTWSVWRRLDGRGDARRSWPICAPRTAPWARPSPSRSRTWPRSGRRAARCSCATSSGRRAGTGRRRGARPRR